MRPTTQNVSQSSDFVSVFALSGTISGWICPQRRTKKRRNKHQWRPAVRCWNKVYKSAAIRRIACNQPWHWTARNALPTQNFFTPLQAHGMEKFTAWRGRKFSLATQKNKAITTESARSNKFLQNKQRYTTKQPLAVSHWPLAKQRTPHQRHPNHTSFKKIKDVFDERRRITRLTLFNLLTLTLSSSSLQGIA